MSTMFVTLRAQAEPSIGDDYTNWNNLRKIIKTNYSNYYGERIQDDHLHHIMQLASHTSDMRSSCFFIATNHNHNLAYCFIGSGYPPIAKPIHDSVVMAYHAECQGIVETNTHINIQTNYIHQNTIFIHKTTLIVSTITFIALLMKSIDLSCLLAFIFSAIVSTYYIIHSCRQIKDNPINYKMTTKNKIIALCLSTLPIQMFITTFHPNISIRIWLLITTIISVLLIIMHKPIKIINLHKLNGTHNE